MQISCLLCVYAIWLKVSPAVSESWNAEVPLTVNGLAGSCVVIPCLFKYPGAERKTSHFKGIWYMNSYETVFHTETSKISSTFQQRTSLLGDLGHRNCSLKINPLRSSDSGPFTFRIEIEDFDKFTFGHNKVSVSIKDSPDQPTLSISEEMSSGKKVTITCLVFHSCPSDPPKITWSHKGLTSSQSLKQTNGEWKIISSLSFTPSKSDHQKHLTCTAEFLGGKKSSSMETLKVKYAPENVAVVSDYSVVEGSDLNMTCTSESNPASHTYHWFTEGGTLLSEKHTFTLKNVSRHIGSIYCRAINTEGQADSRPIQLNVLFPPEFKVGSSCTVDITGVTCLCIVDSHPASEIKLWGADPSSELRRTHEEKHGSLTIVTLQGALGISDIVHCGATNSQGNYTLTLQVPYSLIHNIKVYISIAVVALIVIIIGLSVWITKQCRRNAPEVTPQPKMEVNATSLSEPQRKFKDVSPSCYGSQHVYGNMSEGPYEEEYPYEYDNDYEATYANV
ncbi:myelin-associated glycoprotein-like isoform X2 [Silurus meridionalis]|uniref:myelin-associated glycoprotein-like isoform X2 n=1 Tax=Silurus meridionalis TaxID=175797 RepID=UPI001EEA8DF3|nr:myelin-associated glycoprotein-like isoform X2 [Silurus meridionalis]